MADANAAATENALVRLKGNKVVIVAARQTGLVAVKATAVDIIAISQILESAGPGGFAAHAVVGVIGQQQREDVPPDSGQLGAFGYNFHARSHWGGTGGLRILQALDFHHAEATAAVSLKARVIAQGGNKAPGRPGHRKHGRPLSAVNFQAVYLCGYHFFVHQKSPLAQAFTRTDEC